MKKILRQLSLAVALIGVAVSTSSCGDVIDTFLGVEDNPASMPVYKYLHYNEARDNMSTNERAQYKAYCWRQERKDKLQEPKNWRTCLGEFKESEESELFPDPDYQPSTEGLKTLNISGSSDFSAKELDWIKTEIQKLTDGPIYIIDVRGESHGLLNGIHVSSYGANNWGNVGKTHDQIIAERRKPFMIV